MTTDFQKRDTASGQFIQRPKFKKEDLVTVDGNRTRRAVWIVKQVLPPTAVQPQYGYYLTSKDADRKHNRTADEDRLTLAGDS